jgi:hypothetical protein
LEAGDASVGPVVCHSLADRVEIAVLVEDVAVASL